MHLNVFVSQSCFLHCKGCYSFSREEEKGKIVSTDNLVKFLEFAHSVGVDKITLCGGDPLTRSDIIDLLEKIKKIGFNISLDTVGTSILNDVVCEDRVIAKKTDAKKIANLVDTIGIPIDGSTNEIFRRFRQTNTDIINQQMKICQELHRFGGNICINTVAHKGNLEDAYSLAMLIKNMGFINKWQIFQYMPMGKFGLKNRECFEISEKEFKQFQTEVLKIFDKESEKVQFKDWNKRKNIYMLIDNSGNAWIPSMEKNDLSNNSYNLNANTIIGNITHPEDWTKICEYLDETHIGKLENITEKDTNIITLRRGLINLISNNNELQTIKNMI